MAGSFTLEGQIHVVGDRGCPACSSTYPQPCPCGGLMHGASAVESLGGAETVGAIEGDSEALTTGCDAGGRSEDDLAEEELA